MPDGKNFNYRFKGDSSDLDKTTIKVKQSFDNLDKSTKKADKGFKGLTSRAKSAGGGLLSLKGGVVGLVAGLAAGAVALTKFAISQIKVTDENIKLSKRLQISLADLDTFRITAERSGTSVDSIGKAFKGVQTQLLDAQRGLKSSKDNFDALGLSIEELSNLDPAELFETVALELGSLTNANEKAALATKLFGRAGTELIPLLDDMAKNIEKARLEQAQFLDVLSPQDERNIEDAADALGTVGIAFEGLGRQLAKDFAPSVTIASTAFADFIGLFITTNSEEIEELTEKLRVQEKIWGSLEGTWRESLESSQNVKNQLAETREELEALTGITVEHGDTLDTVNAKIEALRAAEEKLAAEERKAIEDAENLVRAREDEAKATEAAEVGLQKLLDKYVVGRKTTRELQAEIKALEGAVSSSEQGTERYETAVVALEAAQKKLRAEQDKLTESTVEGGKAIVTYSENLETGITKIEILTDLDAKVAAANDELRGKVIATGVSIGDQTEVIKDQIDVVTDWKESLGDVLDIFDLLGIGSDKLRGRLRSGIALFDDGGLFGENGTISKAGGLLDQIGGAGSIGGGLRLLAGGPLAAIGGAGSTIGQSFARLTGLGEYSGQYLGNAAGFGEGLGFQGKSAIGAGLVGNVLGGLAGNYLGGIAGESIFGKQATSNVGSTIGGIAGSFFGPLGAFAGSGLGSLLDSAFGRENRRQAVGFFAQPGNVDPRGGYLGDRVDTASGLTIRGYARRSQQADADEIAEAAGNLDLALTTISRFAGLDVDFRGKTLGGQGFNEAFTQGTGGQLPGGGRGFFGLSGNFGLEGTAEDAARDFVIQWVDLLGDQISDRAGILLDRTEGTAEELVGAFEKILQIDQLLDIDVVGETEAALQALGSETRILKDIYDDSTASLVQVASRFDGSIRGLDELSAALVQQKSVAIELALAHKSVNEELTAQLGSTAERIRVSQLGEDRLAEERRNELAGLIEGLSLVTSPDSLRESGLRIDQLVSQIYDALSPEQQAAEAREFIALLEDVSTSIAATTEEQLAALKAEEEQVGAQVDAALLASESQLDAAGVSTMASEAQQEAARQMLEAANAHLQAVNNQNAAFNRFEDLLDIWGTLPEGIQESLREILEEIIGRDSPVEVDA